MFSIMAVLGSGFATPVVPNADNVLGCDGLLATDVTSLVTTGGGYNQFAADLAQAGGQWTKHLCSLDSDGDGITNGEELGDAACSWSPLEAPSVTDRTLLTHPGYDCAHLNCDGTPDTTIRPPPVSSCKAYDGTSNGLGVQNITIEFADLPVPNGSSHWMQLGTLPVSEDVGMIKYDFSYIDPDLVHHVRSSPPQTSFPPP